ncbi:MAG: hypothetical protein E6J41_16850 [Chloroflexi bacterium]|nr:MAG: hypothetical protein E6J41_16850 [Chloroflexota bacterium]
MSRTAGEALPAALQRLLDGTDLEGSAGLTVQLLTVDESGWPRVALLSAGEVLATGPRAIALALWPDGTSAANLGRSGRATLALVHAGAGWYVRCAALREADLGLDDGRALAAFALRVQEVLEDAVPYAELTGGIAFRLADPGRTLAAWRAASDALRRRRDQTGV